MKNKIQKNYFNILIKVGVIVVLIVAATTNQEYSYYTLVRWIVMTTFIYFGYLSYKNKQIGLLIFYIATAIMFNPFYKFWFKKDTWHLIDFLISGILVIIIIYDLITDENNKIK